MLRLHSVYGIHCDALVDDNESLVFTSLWGRDTAIQELLARLSLPLHEGGLSQLDFQGENSEGRFQKVVHIGNLNQLDKLTGRMPKANIFGDIVQLWLFDKRVSTPDYVNKQAYLLWPHTRGSQALVGDMTEKTWQLVKSVCHLPLLDIWQDQIMKLLRKQGWVTISKGCAIDSIGIKLPEIEFDQEITEMIQSGQLTLRSIKSGDYQHG